MAASFVAPNLAQLLKSKAPTDKYYTKKVIKHLEEEGIIFLAGERVKLTKRGRDLLTKIEADDITITKIGHWDKVWHLVSYDIPEKKKRERDYFRRKLIVLGFKQIHDSLWVIPWECREEIAIFCQSTGISPYIVYLNTNHLPQQNKLIRYFELFEPNEDVN